MDKSRIPTFVAVIELIAGFVTLRRHAPAEP